MFFDKSVVDFVSEELDQTEERQPKAVAMQEATLTRHSLPKASMSSLDKVPKFKVVVLGEQSVGKTSIVSKFLNGTFDEGYQATIGVDFLAATVVSGNQTVRLQIWDTAGQERFHSLIPAYIRDCSAAIVVYDATKLDSFDWVDKWFSDVRRQQETGVVLALVGNKVDLVQQKQRTRQVSIEEAQAKAKQHAALFYEASAKTGYNIQHVFNKLTEMCLEDHLERQYELVHSLSGTSKTRHSAETAVTLAESRYEFPTPGAEDNSSSKSFCQCH